MSGEVPAAAADILRSIRPSHGHELDLDVDVVAGVLEFLDQRVEDGRVVVGQRVRPMQDLDPVLECRGVEEPDERAGAAEAPWTPSAATAVAPTADCLSKLTTRKATRGIGVFLHL